MKLLKIAENAGQFLGASGAYVSIDKITKEDLLRLVGQVLEEDSADLDEFDVDSIKNQAHQVIYKSVSQKLNDLRKRRTEFLDESARPRRPPKLPHFWPPQTPPPELIGVRGSTLA